ncbi:hypothetical protein M408DRAFT_323425 [Serendipita vermifera MAFF 305830]|uniref:CFEM domain-containing protein n=1 Tax=Serendipita vermifera MAFF 305830 TaxID=933852 RepID=A0A0C3BGN4_SERVB|nr:hypothetical protein M408DRAFT_323425 [Serendipita vermifera MAFF 305830]
MRGTSLIVSCILLATATSTSALLLWRRQDLQPPTCAVVCLNTDTSNVTLDGCIDLSTTCLCQSTDYVQGVIDCFATQCPIHDDVLAAIQFTTSFCGVAGVNTPAGLTTPLTQLQPSTNTPIAGTSDPPANPATSTDVPSTTGSIPPCVLDCTTTSLEAGGCTAPAGGASTTPDAVTTNPPATPALSISDPPAISAPNTEASSTTPANPVSQEPSTPESRTTPTPTVDPPTTTNVGTDSPPTTPAASTAVLPPTPASLVGQDPSTSESPDSTRGPTSTTTGGVNNGSDVVDVVASVSPWDPRIAYSPEDAWAVTTSESSIGNCHNGTRVATVTGATIAFPFEGLGKQVAALICNGSKSGNYSVNVDGIPVANLNGYKDPNVGGNECILAPTFGSKAANAGGGTAVEFGGFIYLGPHAFGTDQGSKPNIAAIIGGIVGGVVGGILIIILIVVIVVRKRRNRRVDGAPAAVHTISASTGTPYSTVPTTEYYDPYASSGYGPSHYPNPTSGGPQPAPAWTQTNEGPFGSGTSIVLVRPGSPVANPSSTSSRSNVGFHTAGFASGVKLALFGVALNSF